MSAPENHSPHDPRARRFDGLGKLLGINRIIVAAAALVAIVLPGGTTTHALALIALIGTVASAPLRVGWLAQRWLRRGDRRFGALALLLFLMPALGLGLSALV